MSWDDQGFPALVGNQAGAGWKLRGDPRNAGMSHPVLRRLTRYLPRSAKPDAWWLWNASARKFAGQPELALSGDDVKFMHSVYSEQHANPGPVNELSAIADRARSATIGDQTYQVGDDVRFLCSGDDGVSYKWFARISDILIHTVHGEKRAVWFRLRFFVACKVRGVEQYTSCERRIVSLKPDPEPLPFAAACIDSPIAVFHNCRLPSDGDLKSAPVERKRVTEKGTFSSVGDMKRHGGLCGVTQVLECAVHGRACANLACVKKGLPRFVHDSSRNVYAVEHNWTGH